MNCLSMYPKYVLRLVAAVSMTHVAAGKKAKGHESAEGGCVRKGWKRIAILAGVLAALLGETAGASPVVTLQDGSSTVTIDPYSSAGVTEWKMGDTSQLARQWFWFRTNLSGWNTREYAVNEISAPVISKPAPNYAQIKYTTTSFSVQLTYVLVGGAGGDTSDLSEVIKITNRSASKPLVFTLFQYSNFHLDGTPIDDVVWIEGGRSAYQVDYASQIYIAETVVTGNPDLSEVGPVLDTLSKLTDLDVDDLNGSTLWNTPGDLSWSFEWKNRTISASRSLLISKDKALYTEPVAEPAGLGMVGLVLLALRKRRS